jgi:hypothetical protein
MDLKLTHGARSPFVLDGYATFAIPISSQGRSIGLVHDNFGDGEQIARLFTASLDMLAALEAIATYDPTKLDAATLGNIARAAVAKAKGA